MSEPVTKKDIEELKQIIKQMKNDLKGLVEIQQRLIHERLNVPCPPSPIEYVDEPRKKSTIEIKNHSDDKIIVSGKTYDVKDAIKLCRAKFDNDTKSWILNIDSLDVLTEKFKQLGLEEGKDFISEVKVPKKKEPEEQEDGGFGDI